MRQPFALLCIILLVATTLGAQAESSRPKNGLALAGGGALGFAHVGVLKVLREANIPIHAVAGTSMGSIVGAAFASGATIEEIEKVIVETDWDDLFRDGPDRPDLPFKDKPGRNREILGDSRFGVVNGSIRVPAGILQGQRIRPVLQRLFHRHKTACEFDRLPVRYRAVAADIETGQAVILNSGDLATATRASMAVPGVFGPVDLDGKLLVDGGIANNLPIDIVQSLGADRIIAVELYAELKRRDQLTNPVSLSGQMLSLLLAQNSALQLQKLKPSDILIAPKLNGFSTTSFHAAADLIARGEEAARALLPRLRRFAVSPEEYARYEATRTAPPEPDPSTLFVHIENRSTIPDAVIRRALALPIGEVVADEALNSAVTRVYDLGAFSQVSSVRTVNGNGEHGVTVTAVEKETHQQNIRFGLALEDDFDGDSFYNLAVGGQSNNIGWNGGYGSAQVRLGRISSLKGEFADPWYKGSNFFYAVDGFLDQRSLFLSSDDELVAEYQRRTIQGGFRLGYGFWGSWEAALGYRRGHGDLDRRVGSPALPEVAYDTGDIYSRIVLDTLDDVDFPSRGLFVRGGISRSLGTLGSSGVFTEYSAEIVKPFNLGPIDLRYNGEFSWSDGTRPVGRSFSLGGFLDLSGFTQASLIASDYARNRFMYLHRLDENTSLLGYTIFAGTSVEVATLRSDIQQVPDCGVLAAGSIFLGMNTPILPLYLGYGYAEGGNTSIYLVLGRATSASQRYDGG